MERRNAHGKVKPLKTLKNKEKFSRPSNQTQSRINDEKVNQILKEHSERLAKKDRKSYQSPLNSGHGPCSRTIIALLK